MLARDICGWELRWTLRNLMEKDASKLSESMRQRLGMAESMTADVYRDALHRREEMRARHTTLAPLADAMITLSSTGPAPPMGTNVAGGEPGITHTTGLPAFNAATSALGSPAITVPLMAIGGMPVGVQVIGQPHTDHRLGGIARWMVGAINPVVM